MDLKATSSSEDEMQLKPGSLPLLGELRKHTGCLTPPPTRAEQHSPEHLSPWSHIKNRSGCILTTARLTARFQ